MNEHDKHHNRMKFWGILKTALCVIIATTASNDFSSKTFILWGAVLVIVIDEIIIQIQTKSICTSRKLLDTIQKAMEKNDSK